MIEYGTASYRKITLSLALGSFLIFCNLYLFQPILPLLAKEFAMDETRINWIFAATTLALSVSLVPWAIASESFGRRITILIGLFAIPVIGVSLIFDNSFYLLVAGRAILGLAIAAYAAVAVAYMAEELSAQAFSKAIGTYIAANSLGGITGRLAGGILSEWLGWQQAVLFIAALTLLGAILIAYMLPHQQHFKPQKGLFYYHNRAIIRHLKNKMLWIAMLIGGANFALFVNIYTVMGFRLVAAPHNLSIGLASMIFLCYLAGTLSSTLAGRWSQKHHPIKGILLGTLFNFVGLCMGYMDSIGAMIACLLLLSMGGFFVHTLAYAWVSQKATEAKATATALYLVHYYIGGSIGGFLLIYSWQTFAWMGIMTAGGILCIAVGALSFTLRHQEETQIPDHADQRSNKWIKSKV
ncbi:MFS transporter [Vibrio profundum]|uniref:MFS transporter n=1 Tax=Vibrio profundum TaxID=2910247 RepID=UPI003D129A33